MNGSETDSFEAEYAKQDDTVFSPDRGIRARLVGGSLTELKFRPGAYARYTESELEHQLVQLARLTNVARTRGYWKSLEKVLGHGEPIDKRGPGSPGERALREAADRTEVATNSHNIRIQVRGGTKDWQLRIRPGTVQRLEEAEFLRELRQLFQETVSRWQAELAGIRLRTLGPSEILKGLRPLKKEPRT